MGNLTNVWLGNWRPQVGEASGKNRSGCLIYVKHTCSTFLWHPVILVLSYFKDVCHRELGQVGSGHELNTFDPFLSLFN